MLRRPVDELYGTEVLPTLISNTDETEPGSARFGDEWDKQYKSISRSSALKERYVRGRARKDVSKRLREKAAF